MKICAIICEYNPFHNGHLYQLQEAKRRSGADAILCLMSGNFVQRGEAAIMNKYIRAKHAVLAGADIVIELPTVFATSNAELFAKGAVHILSSIPAVTTLCFGAETADKNLFISAAKQLINEPQEVSESIKTYVANGVSYAKARAQAWEKYIPQAFLTAPNNILGIEYTKAILQENAKMDILPIERIGSGYRDKDVQENYSSATAIRTAITQKLPYQQNLPDFVLPDLPSAITQALEILEKYALLCRTAEEIATVCDCREGLENALKKAAVENASLVETLTSARYTSSRIRRIALQNLLTIDENLIRECLSAPLYLRVLALKKEGGDLLSALSDSTYPLLIRAHDEEKLEEVAKQSFGIDAFAEKIHNLLYPSTHDKNIFV